MKKMIIAGAGGMLGKAFYQEFKNNYNLTCTDIDLNESWLTYNDFGDLESYKELCFKIRPDILIHLAWQGLPNYMSLHHFEIELPVQYDFLSALIKEGLQSLVVVGTCFEYGMQSNSLSEELDTKPSNPYGFAKDCLRKQLKFLKKQHNFKLTWARLFYLYGDGQSDSSIYSQLKTAIQNSELKFDMSEGEQLRDYLPVEKVAKYLIDLALLKKDIGVVNVCSGVPISVRNLVENWLDENNWGIELNLGFYPYPNYEPMNFWGDNTYLNKLINSTNNTD